MLFDGWMVPQRILVACFWFLPIIAWIIYAGTARVQIHWFKFLALLCIIEFCILIAATEVELAMFREVFRQTNSEAFREIWQMRAILWMFAVLYALVWPPLLFGIFCSVEGAVRMLRRRTDRSSEAPSPPAVGQ